MSANAARQKGREQPKTAATSASRLSAAKPAPAPAPYRHPWTMSDVRSALEEAHEAIDKATLVGQDLESVADGGGPPSDEDFARLYRELRAARGAVDLVLECVPELVRVGEGGGQ